MQEAMILGKVIWYLRQSRGMTQHELANSAQVSRAQIATIESGYSNSHLDTLVALSKGLGMPFDDLLAVFSLSVAATVRELRVESTNPPTNQRLEALAEEAAIEAVVGLVVASWVSDRRE